MSRQERAARGKAARSSLPLSAHAEVIAAAARPDAVEQLESTSAGRIPELVPIRYGRMLASPFAFFRGAAALMAYDLGVRPNSGLRVQLCGDAHLSNFGVFGSAERRLVFDVNDFDETLPGPFEWDLKRLAASIEVAGRHNGFSRKRRRAVVLDSIREYREAMRAFAAMPNLAVWYASVDADQLLVQFREEMTRIQRKRTRSALAKARSRDNLRAFAKLTTVVDGQVRIVSDPPLVVPVEDVYPQTDVAQLYDWIAGLVRAYARTLPTARRTLLGQFRLVQVARKVVGVGSVGTRAWILLMEGVDSGDPLFLQAKEATRSVLEPYAGASRHRNQGERVVVGQQRMQASSDIFLGWQRTTTIEGVARDFYLRQLHDWKGSMTIEGLKPGGMSAYGRLCGWTLARAHARSGDRIAIAAYLGGKRTFDEAIAEFAVGYADLNEQDHGLLREAAVSGRIAAAVG